MLPLALLLHGAGGSAESGIQLLQPLAEAAGLLLLAPASRRTTWDVISGGYGPDVELIDRALAEVFTSFPVDPSSLAIGGFSDGASYALSLGLTNGDLFSHIIAFSPGFVAPAQPAGTPHIFVSHGTHDTVLPIDHCSRRIVPRLKRAGYAVTYREFDGPHTVPVQIAREAITWYNGPDQPPPSNGAPRA
jgi:phospholipase/carboxylesterase